MLLYLLGVLVVFVGVCASIALHEIGHLVPAKMSRVKVSQYMVGFGPTIWSTRRGETEYGIKAIPLGGYVRMLGMLPPRPGDRPGTLRESSTGRWGAMIDDARAAALEEIGPQDAHRVFYRLPTWRKVMIMGGGPFMNLLIAAVLTTGVLTLHGAATLTPLVGLVSQCAPASPEQECRPGDAPSPARAAGLRQGDRILTVDGTPVATWGETTRLIREAGDRPLQVRIERAGEERTLQVRPVLRQRPVVDAHGLPVVAADGTVATSTVGFLGATGSVETVRQPLSVVPDVLGQQIKATAGVILNLPQRMVDVWQAAFGSEERDPEGPMSVVGVGRVAGEVSQHGVGDLVQSPADRLALLISLIAGLNIALFVFNLVPLMPLDGGHIAGALWEGLKRLAARVTGRPDPGYVDVAKGLPVAYAVSVLLLGMSALLIYADLVKPVTLGG